VRFRGPENGSLFSCRWPNRVNELDVEVALIVLRASQIECGPEAKYVTAEGYCGDPMKALRVCEMPRPEPVKSGAPAQDAWLTAQECADYFKINKETLLRMVRSKTIPFVRMPGPGKLYRFRREAIERWAEAHTMGRANIRP
jgi:excisionase family DNA binding protein